MALAAAIGAASADIMCNAYVDQLDASAGSLKVFSGAVPANCAASDPSGPLVTITLPTPAFGTSAGSGAAKSGTWSGTASGAGDAASFRVYLNGGTCIAQGSAGVSGDTVNLVFDNKTIAVGAAITITAFTVTQPLA